jgi:hypothetical protein
MGNWNSVYTDIFQKTKTEQHLDTFQSEIFTNIQILDEVV